MVFQALHIPAHLYNMLPQSAPHGVDFAGVFPGSLQRHPGGTSRAAALL